MTPGAIRETSALDGFAVGRGVGNRPAVGEMGRFEVLLSTLSTQRLIRKDAHTERFLYLTN